MSPEPVHGSQLVLATSREVLTFKIAAALQVRARLILSPLSPPVNSKENITAPQARLKTN